jgi:hypothetical protein
VNTRVNLVLIFAGVIVLVFLAGFLPEHFRADQFKTRAQEATNQLEFCRVRDLAGMTFLQTSLKNYGLAGHYSTEFFDAAKRLAASTQRSDVQQALQTALAKRDTITGQLARGDEAAYGSIQAVYSSLVASAAGPVR